MAGRLAYMAMTGGAILAAMVLQGDINFNDRVESRHEEKRIDRIADRAVDRTVDGRVDRRVERSLSRADERQRDAATRRALSAAIAELARAEGSLITLKMDDAIPADVIEQAEERRNAARAEVERVADDAKVDNSAERDALRETIRESVRDAVRS